VVDQSNERRGMASINAVWKNKIAVLVGDYLLSRGLLMAVNNGEFEFLRVTSDAVKRMSEGELLQIQKSRQSSIDEATYFRIISDKTASLISTCCEIGAQSSDASPEVRQAMRAYGELVGQAFQIRDDVLDYTSRSAILGKPTGNDIVEQKITLPLIYACAAAPPADGASIIKLVKGRKPRSREVEIVMKFVERHRGVELAQNKALELQTQAIRLLDALPSSSYKTALIDFAKFVVERPA
jgi:octaprenyl-diphosphate synthase